MDVRTKDWVGAGVLVAALVVLLILLVIAALPH
jgi:hypothetical protein